ncbi:uncharacterized protein L203_105879 [Cryptococcus depauperatus CBS 7841]|uniref:Uncharacterized protein n=1 Tax=Cryptococcus depauperatus CBS 7841 TaxID=1295531 RepID=A0A1E3IAB8_9TREE|nr:hypothetical protein L203_05034 [Cryptococcus depauperatus CBS 7841]
MSSQDTNRSLAKRLEQDAPSYEEPPADYREVKTDESEVLQSARHYYDTMCSAANTFCNLHKETRTITHPQNRMHWINEELSQLENCFSGGDMTVEDYRRLDGRLTAFQTWAEDSKAYTASKKETNDLYHQTLGILTTNTPKMQTALRNESQTVSGWTKTRLTRKRGPPHVSQLKIPRKPLGSGDNYEVSPMTPSEGDLSKDWSETGRNE